MKVSLHKPDVFAKRFTFFPHECEHCQQKFFLETMYRKWHHYGWNFGLKWNRDWICKRCYLKQEANGEK